MKTSLTSEEKTKLLTLIHWLDQEYKDFVMQDTDTQLDIIENDMDTEEIAMMVSANISRGYTSSNTVSGPSFKESQLSRTISIRMPEFQINFLKQKAEYSGLWYQSIINMLVTHYMRGAVKLEI